MIDELLIQESAVFYKITHEEKGQYFIPKGTIKNIFETAGKRRVGKFIANRVKEAESPVSLK